MTVQLPRRFSAVRFAISVRSAQRARRRTLAIAAAAAAACALALLTAPGAALAATSFTGGADDYPLYVPNDHTAVSIHFSASGLTPSQQYNVKLRFNTSATPGGTSNRGFTWSPSYTMWVQERDASWNATPNFFPVVTADSSGAVTGNAGWLYGKFGDTTKSDTYYIIVSLEPVGSTSGATVNALTCPAITVVDMASAGCWMHNGIATGVTAAKRAEADLDATSTVHALQKTEANTCDDDGDGVTDNEDYGPFGKTGDFRLAVPTGNVYDIYLGSHTAWGSGQNKTSAIADVDLAIGATDESAPTQVTGLTAATRNAAVDLSWDAGSDNTAVTAYAVYRWTDPVGGSPYTALHARIATVTTGTSYTDSGLTNGTKYSYEVRAIDAATNVGPRSNTAGATPDGTAPVTTDNIVDGVWHKQFTLVLTPLDDSSGVAFTEFRVNGGDWMTGTGDLFRILRRHRRSGYADGSNTVEYRSTDVARNVETIVTATVLLDDTAPTTTDDAPATPQSTDVTVNLTPDDAQSGIATTSYCLDDGPWVDGTAVPVAAPTDHGNDGEHIIWYYSVDNADNAGILRSCTVTIDTSAPAAPRAFRSRVWPATTSKVLGHAKGAVSRLRIR